MAIPLAQDSTDVGVRLSTLSPKYLHTNSTSHTWPFSAIAELIDNAYDPDVNARQLWIDVKRYHKYNYCLVFTDNGAGMGPEKLHKMLSFGFCDKVAKNGHMPVGHYGNGFKSGSMRLGKDAIVFTKNGDTKSVGFLSQTYLEAIKAETILVPMVTWDSDGKIVQKSDKDKALQDILTHSMFKHKEELFAEFAGIQNPGGTRIIIFNVRTTSDGKPEFDFSTALDDIKIPEDTDSEISKLKRQERQNHIPESDYSLRAYCAILYLKPRMQIILRGKKVRTMVITKSLSKTEMDYYRPSLREGNTHAGALNGQKTKITFGFSQNRNHYGIMMYHRNRLIKPYVRVGYQLKFRYIATIAALGSKLNDYWNEKKGPQRANSKEPIPEPVEVQQLPDQSWVQCDDCLKWRKLPHGTDLAKLPDKWYCKDNPNPKIRSCSIPEEKEDEVEQAYVKTQKKRLEKEMEDKKRKEKEKKAEEARKAEIQQKTLERKEAELQRLRQQLSEMESAQEPSIMQTIEKNSARQQQAIRQQVKGEQKSPQPLRIKLIQSPSDNLKSSSGQPHTQVVSGNIRVSNAPKPPLILRRNVNQQQQQASVKVVKVFSSVPSNQSQTVSKPLVQIVPNPQGQVEQQTPKVVSVQSLQQQVSQGQSTGQQKVAVQNMVLSSGHKVHLTTPISQSSTPTSFQVRALPIQPSQPPKQQQGTGVVTLQTTPVSHNQVPQQSSTPLKSPAISTSYKPLESLQEVNRQATQASVVSPVSAVIPEVNPPTKQSPTELRNHVTMQDRFRYIAPSPQTQVASVPVSSAAAGAVAQPVQTPTVKPTVKIGAQSVASTANQVLQVQIKQEPKPAVPVSPMSSGPGIQISQVHSGTPAVGAFTGLTLEVKTEKADSPLVKGNKRAHDSDDDVIEQPVPKKPRAEEIILIDSPPPAPPSEEKPTEGLPDSDGAAVEGVDNDLIVKLSKLNKEQQWITLAQSAQQLRNLRDNVCKLLRVLVPEIDLGEKSEILDDTTIDNLLKQVLEANVSPDVAQAT
ncbi:MORC family CW-type zinc finger protein 3-like [Stylophora pistillata]|uniref:MORC family CW-type zinc finger protein 3-like n=1 Tax=Stylophora pistillata TaxID=50429 RepID=UPI000C041CA0|nr:MORC family CW-type zinc finger protein 3-like [Stylophora pistillata]